MHDAKLPSATACIAGEPIRGSWWGHPKGKLIFETLSRMEDTVAWAKLILGKETLVHERLWPALVAVAESGEDWQLRGLKIGPASLLRRVRRGARLPIDRKLGADATELERRLLARGTSEHTTSGHHARFLETWGAWAKRVGVKKRDLPATAAAQRALSSVVRDWIDPSGPARILPWLDRAGTTLLSR